MKSKHSKIPNEVDKYAGESLRIIRKTKGLTQRELAKKVHITFQQIQKYEKGINRISIGTLYDICNAMEISPAQFLKDSYAKYKLAESSLTPTESKILGKIKTHPLKVQKNILKYINNLVKNNEVKKEK